MVLYMSAESEKHIGYTPDWIKICYNDNGVNFEITFDIQGEISYKNDGLDCRVKGELIPWCLYNIDSGKEWDLGEIENVDKLYPIDKIIDIFENGNEYIVGIYPVLFDQHDNDESVEKVKADKISKGTCIFEYGYKDYSFEFDFDSEINIWD